MKIKAVVFAFCLSILSFANTYAMQAEYKIVNKSNNTLRLVCGNFKLKIEKGEEGFLSLESKKALKNAVLNKEKFRVILDEMGNRAKAYLDSAIFKQPGEFTITDTTDFWGLHLDVRIEDRKKNIEKRYYLTSFEKIGL